MNRSHSSIVSIPFKRERHSERLLRMLGNGNRNLVQFPQTGKTF